MNNINKYISYKHISGPTYRLICSVIWISFVPVELYTVFSGPKTLVTNLATNLIKNLVKNLTKNLVNTLSTNLAPQNKKYFWKVTFRSMLIFYT